MIQEAHPDYPKTLKETMQLRLPFWFCAWCGARSPRNVMRRLPEETLLQYFIEDYSCFFSLPYYLMVSNNITSTLTIIYAD